MLLLKPEQRSKLDESNDNDFYAYPRFVTHVDQGFIDQLTGLYRERLKPDTRILDMMSSWVSHLPEEMNFSHVEGHGMNEEELAKNLRLDHYFLQNLNLNPKLPLEDLSFDAVLNTVSVQYLQYPEAIFSEIRRILKPNGIAIISFSNRMFYQKAIGLWRDSSEKSRLEIVKRYFQNVPGFSQPEIISNTSNLPSFLQMIGITGSDPFYAVISHRLS
jgi:Methyltransferase domain